jgi:16S rRNA (guanine527-N7)-methyltransferase
MKQTAIKPKKNVDSDWWREKVEKAASLLGVSLSRDQLLLLSLHARLLLKWTARTNLTTITNPEEMALKHFADSLALSKFLPEKASVLDMGSGGGFPGLVLKTARPDLTVTLMDAVRKKVSFLIHVITEGRLKGISAVQGRAENMAEIPGFAKAFDAVVSRAFSDLGGFIRLAAPFLKTNGRILAMKGPGAEKEVKKVQAQCNQMELTVRTFSYNLPDKGGAARCIVEIK